MNRLITFLGMSCLVTLLTSCLESGRPIVTEQSSGATPPEPSDAGVRKPRVITTRQATDSNIPVVYLGPLPESVVVERGDTLYRIAWRYGLTFEQLAQFNRLEEPFTIFPGQRLRIRGAQLLRVTDTVQPNSRTTPPRKTTATAPEQPASTPATARPKGRWVWPLPPPPDETFSAARKGLDFKVSGVTSIKATQSGMVVYAGNGIGGFERLVIIKHASNLLSAYSFNGTIIVTEQTQVKAGQKIADIRDTGHKTQTAHFELRRSGQPVDPVAWLEKS